MAGLLPDPVDVFLEAEERRDHDRALARGLRVRDAADAVLSVLEAHGNGPRDRAAARVVVFSVLADVLYGNAAIDIPTLVEVPE
jgi:hypothetical protein